ncbi:outer membrane receptor for ferric coprogen and ferric-rhodotorulic acid [Pseudomonas hunanensis]|uniref:Outer membrane receptor for ferric coprogen and ferric-rhodotorulic acid n=1 Tax=Pseudomonas hunanensis TaxID=1247546 RepID=A0ACC6K552_9PSED|nr:TonB-dependent siderophore receptor [Pseudomonas hunanensis]MDR6713555.1 outer membrane receptor for ferric coprogen and ferric-rhodotorulic acid [Pseudomonas hunanensis]
MIHPGSPRNDNLRHAVRAALLGLSLAGACAVPLQAPAATASQRQQIDWNIAPGPLAPALDQMARQGGLNLSFDANSLQGKTTGGVQGRHDSAQALSILLQGSNVQVQQESDTSFLLIPAIDVGSAMELGATSISSNRLGETTEHSGSYTTGAVTIGKTPQSIRRTPQSVTVVTRQRIEDQNITNLTNLLEQTPGVVVNMTDSERVQYYSRGYSIDAIQYDGATVVQGSGNGSFIQSDSAIIDRAEILRGATGMLRGAGNPSGTVNLVRKRPTAEFQGEGSVTLGSWDAQRYVADLSGPLTETGNVRGRVIAVHDDKDLFQSSRHERKDVFYGVLAFDLNDSTTLTTGLEWTKLDATGAWGNLPADYDGSPLRLGRSTYLGADWNRWDRSNLQTFAELERRFDNDWKLKLMAQRTHFELDDHGFKQTYFTRAAGNANPTNNPYLMSYQVTEGDGGESIQNNLSATLNGPFELLGRSHELMLGVERIRNDSYASATNYVASGLFDIREWDPKTSLAEPDINILAHPVRTRTTQEAAYATWRISLADPLTAIIGARSNWYDYEQENNLKANGKFSVDNKIVPYGALIYDLNDNFSTYASYTEIFNPQTATDVSGSVLAPTTGEAYETGIKGEFYDGRLNTSLAFFRIYQVGNALDDLSGPNPCPPNYTSGYCKVASGKNRSQGFELEISGEVLPGWNVSGGYTYNTTKQLKDTLSNTGNAIRTTDPKRMLRLFTSYRLPGELEAWTIGGGVQAQSDIYNRSGNAVATQSGYAVYNAMVNYRFNEHYTLQLNANNLFDKKYYRQVAPTPTGYYWGDPRNVSVTLRGTF